MDYEWRLRLVMAQAGMFKATDLTPKLAAHGIVLSESQVWRLVTGKPERLNLRLLATLCEIFECQPGDLIVLTDTPARKRSSKAKGGAALGKDLVPKQVKLRRPAR
jgi:DNA-binding Xre family transcriptional regulator